MSAFSVIDLQQTTAIQPYYVFQRIAFVSAVEYVLYTVPTGYNYLLRRFCARWDARVAGAVGAYMLSAEIFSTSRCLSRQREPVPIAALAGPGGECVSVLQPGAPLGISFDVQARKISKIVNIPFPYGDTLRLRITTGLPAVSPGFFDLLLEGYLVPESGETAGWGQK